jgi:large subunit ribosomal protein L18
MRTIRKRRRTEGKTDYKARLNLLKSGKPRIIVRKTNKYIIGQFIKINEARDSVSVGIISKDLLDFGWPKEAVGSLKSLPAAYLTGLLLGKRVIEKEGKTKAVFDIGLLRNVKKSRIYAFLKGVMDSGLEIAGKKESLPDENRINGRHLKKQIPFEKIKEAINNDTPLAKSKGINSARIQNVNKK